AMNEMPNSLLDQFAASHGGDIAFQNGTSPYAGGEFLVTGVNEYSFFYRLATGLQSPTDPNKIDSVLAYHIVEASYKGGAWSLFEVAELQTFNFQMHTVVDSISTAIGAPAITTEDGGRGHEIQSAITKDGNTLVLKFVDINGNRPKNQFPAVRVFDRQSNGSYTELDPLTENFDTDIFICTRPKGEPGWSDAKNVTDDADMAFRTYMPKVVAAVDNIPLLRILGAGAGTVSSKLPKAVSQLVYNGGAAIDYANTGVVSVQDEKFYAFRFGNIAPNPVFSTAEVSFTLDRPSSVGIEVYNMLGSQLSSIAPQSMTAGSHGVNVDASTLAAGAYNVALVVDGVRIMKPFIVVR
ncbi:MAG: T9SS type A sorting domain-containing protein, partial [Candidatus Kapabacteria bacterium]|nr:T9SS type A sorting domain-containing protein [Candidatus Kapabacteria bacterium]